MTVRGTFFFKKSKKNEYYQTVAMKCMNSCIPCYWTIHSINVICGLFSSNDNLFTVNFCVCMCVFCTSGPPQRNINI